MCVTEKELRLILAALSFRRSKQNKNETWKELKEEDKELNFIKISSLGKENKVGCTLSLAPPLPFLPRAISYPVYLDHSVTIMRQASRTSQ